MNKETFFSPKPPVRDIEPLKCTCTINQETVQDMVHHPAHYNHGKYEPIDVIHDWGLNFDLGNVVKYIARCDYKGNRLQDLKKARNYLDHEIKSMEEEE